MKNQPALLWAMEGPLETEIHNALTRFTQRPELAGRRPEIITFHPGEAPTQISFEIATLTVDEHPTVLKKHFVLA